MKKSNNNSFILDIEQLKIDLNLTEYQLKELSDVLEIYMKKYRYYGHDPFFNGVRDGLNICYKIINGINDDYNSKIGS